VTVSSTVASLPAGHAKRRVSLSLAVAVAADVDVVALAPAVGTGVVLAQPPIIMTTPARAPRRIHTIMLLPLR